MICNSYTTYLASIACMSMFVACNEKRSASTSAIPVYSDEEIRIAKERLEEDRIFLEKAIIDTLPKGWKLDDKDHIRFVPEHLDTGSSANKSDITHYEFDYMANPTTLMVEEGPRETEFAISNFAGSVLFARKHPDNLPKHLLYPGKTPPPSVEEIIKGKTFVAVRRGHMFFHMKAEIRRSGKLTECVIIEPPKPTGLQRNNLSIYPLDQVKPETYLHGDIDETMGIDAARLLRSLVKDTVSKREAELKADGVDVGKERERIAAIQRLLVYGAP